MYTKIRLVYKETDINESDNKMPFTVYAALLQIAGRKILGQTYVSALNSVKQTSN